MKLLMLQLFISVEEDLDALNTSVVFLQLMAQDYQITVILDNVHNSVRWMRKKKTKNVEVSIVVLLTPQNI